MHAPSSWHCILQTASYLSALQLMIEGAATPESDEDTLTQWRPGKGVHLAASPDGKWLAVCYLDTIRLYSMQVLRAHACSSSMREAEVRFAHHVQHSPTAMYLQLVLPAMCSRAVGFVVADLLHREVGIPSTSTAKPARARNCSATLMPTAVLPPHCIRVTRAPICLPVQPCTSVAGLRAGVPRPAPRERFLCASDFLSGQQLLAD